ncbi:MAG TPA: GNAT family N-acetyltransferase [Gaiellaceae bacterium]|nr:GNAT family N-acetyltransferase [Gaiellaceae bacterium]
MSRPEILPFTDEHVDGAAALLAERHARHRAVEPLLAEPADFRSHVEAEFQLEGTSGAVALDGDEVVGYLLGPRREDFLGPHIWSYVAGQAVRDPELVRDLYRVAAARWVDEGLTRHFVFVPASRELVEPWLRTSFGISGALAVQETTAVPATDTGIEVRPSTPEDTPAAAALDQVLARSLQASPSFSLYTMPGDQEYLDEWKNLHTEDEFTHFVAERDGRIVGHLLLYRRPEQSLRMPAGSIDLANAATDPAARGLGAAVALTEYALRWAHENGYSSMTTDWRMSNLEASRFWPRRGFRESFLRLYRSIP